MAKTLLYASGSASHGAAPISGQINGLNQGSARNETKFQTAGTLSDFQVRVSANTSGTDGTAYIVINGSQGNQTATITAGNTGLFEQSNTDSIAAGDLVRITTPLSSTGIVVAAAQTLFAATTNTVTKLSINPHHSVSTNTSYFYPLGGARTANTTEANAKVRMRKAGTFKNLGVYVSTAASADQLTYLKKNGSAAIFLTCTASNTGWFENAATSSCSVDDDFNFQLFTGTNITGLIIDTFTCEFVTTDSSGLVVVGNSTGIAFTKNTTNYVALGGSMVGAVTTEAFAQTKAKQAFTLSNLEYFVTANGTDNVPPNSFKLRKGGADTALSAPPGTSTGLIQDTTNTVDVVASDLLNYQLINGDASGGTHNITVTWIALFYVVAATGNNVVRALSTETVSVAAGTLANLRAKIRTRSETALTVAESPAVARLSTKLRPITTQTTTISETSMTRARGRARPLATQTVTISETSLARLASKTRALATETTSIATGTLAKLAAKTRALATETITLAEAVDRLVTAGGQNIEKTLEETVTVAAGTLARLSAKNRALSTETTTIAAGTLARLSAKTRALATETTTIAAETLARLSAKARALTTETTTVSAATLARLSAKIRALATETVTESPTLARLATKMRALTTETITLVDAVEQTLTTGQKNIEKTLEETVTVTTVSLVRLATKSRALATETVTVGAGTLARLKSVLRVLTTETITVGAGTVTKLIAKVRTITESDPISENIARLDTKMRALATETITVGENLQRALGTGVFEIVYVFDEVTRTVGHQISRSLDVETVTLSESIARLAAKIRTRSETVTIAETSLTRLAAKARVLTTQIVSLTDAVDRTIAQGTTQVVKTLTESPITISETSLNRLSTKIRVLATQTVTITAGTAAKLSAKTRILTGETVSLTDAVAQLVTSGRLNITKTISTQTVAISESIARRTQKIRVIQQFIDIIEQILVYRNGVELVPPEPTIKPSMLLGGVPRLRPIRYPVYHVTDYERLQRRKKLRKTINPVIFPAFSQQINTVKAPFVVTSLAKNRVTVRFAVARKEPILFVAKQGPIPVQITAKTQKKEAQKAHSAHIMQQKSIEKYGKRLNKFAKLIKLFLVAEEYNKLRD